MVDGLTSLRANDVNIQDITGVELLTHLESLNVNDNQLISLPNSIGNLSNLVTLFVGENQLTSLPESIVNLTNLTSLVLQNNQLVSLPANIGQLSSLTDIYASENQLTNLPTSFLQLTQLNILYLYHNVLPNDFETILNTAGIITPGYPEQLNIMLTEIPKTINVKNAIDFNRIDYHDLVMFNTGELLSLNPNLEMDNLRDDNNQPTTLDTYFNNGKVVKEGTFSFQIRAMGSGVFTNNENAVTVDSVQINFQLPRLSFNLNGGEGTVPATQFIIEGTARTAVDKPVREGYIFVAWNTCPRW